MALSPSATAGHRRPDHLTSHFERSFGTACEGRVTGLPREIGNPEQRFATVASCRDQFAVVHQTAEMTARKSAEHNRAGQVDNLIAATHDTFFQLGRHAFQHASTAARAIAPEHLRILPPARRERRGSALRFEHDHLRTFATLPHSTLAPRLTHTTHTPHVPTPRLVLPRLHPLTRRAQSGCPAGSCTRAICSSPSAEQDPSARARVAGGPAAEAAPSTVDLRFNCTTYSRAAATAELPLAPHGTRHGQGSLPSQMPHAHEGRTARDP